MNYEAHSDSLEVGLLKHNATEKKQFLGVGKKRDSKKVIRPINDKIVFGSKKHQIDEEIREQNNVVISMLESPEASLYQE